MIQPLIDSVGLAEASDETLMKAITNRQQSALDEFCHRYRRTLKAVITRVVNEETEADDVLQEIFLQIWNNARTYSPKAGRPLGWVVTLARRRAIDRLRRRQAYCRVKDRFEAQMRQQSGRGRDQSNDHLVRSDLCRFLRRQLSVLPIRQREAIELSFFEGRSHREISTFTGAPLGTVKTRLELGMRKLTNCIRPLQQKI